MTMMKKNYPCYQLIAIGLIFISIWGCTRFRGTSKTHALKKLHTFQYPEFIDDIYFDGMENSINMSLAYLDRLPDGASFTFGKDTYTLSHMKGSLVHFLEFIRTRPSPLELKRFIKSDYLVYRSRGKKKGRVLFTGYYEPILRGSTVKTPEYPYPVYERPKDHTIIDLSRFSPEFKGKRIIGRMADNTIVPYYERREIENPRLFQDIATPICWVSNAVDLFFLQIQGSGKIALTNGNIINVHYHTTNGHPYRSIGKLLIDRGKIDPSQMSMQRIKTYIEHHPEERAEIFNYNPSYVFFKREEDGPFGCLNVKLTPGRSAATDRSVFPAAALMYITTQKPIVDGDGDIDDWVSFGRFMLNQDTGGAIKGPGRCDIFWGNGPYAEIAAGHLRHDGDLFFLVQRPDTPK